jgi:lysozyme
MAAEAFWGRAAIVTISSVAELVELHEGRKNFAYQDTRGIWTVGVGHNLQAKPLKDDAITLIRDGDIQDARTACEAIFPGLFATFSEPRQAALIDMVFQLGPAGVHGFSGMIAAIQIGDWDTAAADALASRWAQQTPARAQMNAEILRSGEWPARLQSSLPSASRSTRR